MREISSSQYFGGVQKTFEHQSASTRTAMRFSIFLPPQPGPRPCVIYLSGLTCTEDNFTTKAGAQRIAAELGLIVVAPDTSPRGDGVADDEAYDLGMGAGFYVDATQEPWATNYRMYSYCSQELPELLEREFPIDTTKGFGLLGHSMGGHGALTIAMKNPERFRSLSAFAPICAPSLVPWGEKAFSTYLGTDPIGWADYDASILIKVRGYPGSILIDQGTDDQFIDNQLRPEVFEKAAEEGGQQVLVRRQKGYDHSYNFMATFIEDHLRHHAANLN